MKKEKGFIEIILLVFVLFLIFIIGVDFCMTIKNGIGWVWQGRKGTAVKEFIKEENDCVYFIDVWDNKNKACGIYQIKKY